MTARPNFVDGRWRAAFLALMLTIGASDLAAGAQTRSDPARQARTSGQADELRIVSTEFKFTSQSARVVAGQVVTVVLDNSQGETEHQIFAPALGLRVFARAGDVARRDYVFDKPGEYEIVCDLPGHTEAGMKAKVIVEEKVGERDTRLEAAKK
jgi:uncharacterized cupredoxin-like copper-binding protein